jgi:hypothetical protein
MGDDVGFRSANTEIDLAYNTGPQRPVKVFIVAQYGDGFFHCFRIPEVYG